MATTAHQLSLLGALGSPLPPSTSPHPGAQQQQQPQHQSGSALDTYLNPGAGVHPLHGVPSRVETPSLGGPPITPGPGSANGGSGGSGPGGSGGKFLLVRPLQHQNGAGANSADSSSPPPTSSSSHHGGATSQQQQAENEKVYALIADLLNPSTRESALLELSKKREQWEDLALVLWHSFGAAFQPPANEPSLMTFFVVCIAQESCRACFKKSWRSTLFFRRRL